MTVPSNVILPTRVDYPDNEEYERKHNEAIKNYLDDIVKATYGEYQSDFETGQESYIPKVLGATTAGDASYARAVGWTLRRSLMVDVWFDVQWTGHTGTGNMYIELPYIVASTSGLPYVGIIQSSTITYAGYDGLVCNAISNSYRLEIWSTGTGAVTANVPVAVDGRLIGHVRYIGQDDEIANS